MHIAKGDRIFLLRQGRDNPGIIGAGHVARGSYLDKHWDPKRPNDESIFVQVISAPYFILSVIRSSKRSPEFRSSTPLASAIIGRYNPQKRPPDWKDVGRLICGGCRRSPIALAEEIGKNAGFPESLAKR